MPSTMTADQIRDEMKGIDWWHQIELGHGIVSPGRGGSTAKRLEQLHLPKDLSGKSFLDIGAWDGAFSFEAEERGASRIVAVNEKPKPGLELVIRARGSRVESVTADLSSLDPEAVDGPFDVVLFSGVLYHLPNPIAGLERVLALTAPGGLMICETATDLNHLRTPAAALVEDPGGIENYDRNWWRPSWRGAVSLFEQVGFEKIEVVVMPKRSARHRLRKRDFLGRCYNARCVLHARRPQRTAR